MNKLTMKKAREIARKVCGPSRVEKADGEYIVTLGEIVVRMRDRCTDFQNRPLAEVYVGASAYTTMYLCFWTDTLERCHEAETVQWRSAMEEQRQDIIQQPQREDYRGGTGLLLHRPVAVLNSWSTRRALS